MSERALIVFIKQPMPGRVKTRLAAVLGAKAACEIYKFLIEETLRRLPAGPRIILACDPPEALEAIRSFCAPLLPIAEYRGQSSGDLGNRLEDQFAAAFQSGCKCALAIGTDCPALQTAQIAQAFGELERHNVVLGPAADGGYYLIGLARHLPFLFHNMPWSTDRLLTETRAALEQQGKSYALLEPLADLDVLEDLQQLTSEQLQQLYTRVPGLSRKISAVIPD